jgi:acetolactate synthase-1/2/3 large subunit
VVIALPEDMLTDVVEAVDRPRGARFAQAADPLAVAAMMDLLKDACAPIAIVGGAGLVPGHRPHPSRVGGADRAARGRRVPEAGFDPQRQPVWAGNLGYGPNPEARPAVKEADLILPSAHGSVRRPPTATS